MNDELWDAVVVGAGPNGLAAAVTLAQAGRRVLVLEAEQRVGGGLRSDEISDGLVRDRGAAVLPFAVGSPFLSNLPLGDHGLEWAHPEVCYGHPLDDGRAGLAFADLDRTVGGLGADGQRYRTLIEPLSSRWFPLANEVMQPVVHVPRHPLLLARYGLPGLRTAKRMAARFKTAEAQGLIAGSAAHAVLPLTAPFTAAFASLFMASAHGAGWPVVVGGSQRLADALASLAGELGVEIRTDSPVNTLRRIPPARAVLFDVDPHQLERIAGDDLPSRYRKRLRGFEFGPGVFKIDHVLDGPVPWRHEALATAGTVHVGGTFEEIAQAEAEVAAGNHPERPFVLVAQQSAIDATRVNGGRQVLWSYTHVPNGSHEDMTAAMERQIERFAPGFGDRILERHVTTPRQLHALNRNLVGGDIGGGSYAGTQLFIRPRLIRPYRTPNPALFLCSASTPPGGGVHGMAGHRAAKLTLATALR